MANRKSARATTTAPAIASVRDGGLRAFNFARDLATYGAQMLEVWPELANDYADGHALWANFDAGVVDAFDAKNPSILAVKGEDGTWAVCAAGYVKGAQTDQIITAAWCRSRSRTLWAAMKKDDATLYAIARPQAESASVAIREARRVLKDAIRKALTGEGRKGAKSGNRTPVEVITDTLKDLQDSVKSWESRKTLTPAQAKTIRDWLVTVPKI